jgi:UDPglucose--hexose-1-phosphate uridylyltransferase
VLSRPHRRLNPLTGEYVLVSPHRTDRPWQGKVESRPADRRPAYDPTCYLCPGNPRAGGRVNPDYTGTFAFDNDFAALLRSPPCAQPEGQHPLLRAEPENGVCRVVCFSPRHDVSLPEMSVVEIEAVLAAWTEESVRLASCSDIGYVQVFENKGELMGCSNPHPHSQIWATEHLPNEIVKEWRHQSEYQARHGRPLLSDYLSEELNRQERVVSSSSAWAAVVPFWALWPFETLVLPRRHVGTLSDLEANERTELASILKQLTIRYDNLFNVSFPYSMGFHQAPADGKPHPEWVMHLHFYPPLLRAATIKKFMVGYEMLATPGRDLTPEAAATRLKSLSDVHLYAANSP